MPMETKTSKKPVTANLGGRSGDGLGNNNDLVITVELVSIIFAGQSISCKGLLDFFMPADPVTQIRLSIEEAEADPLSTVRGPP